MIRSKEILPDHQQYTNLPIHPMCGHCNIIWENLDSEELDDDVICFCPVCKSDMYLTDTQSDEVFRFHKKTGKIENVLTGKILERKFVLPPIKKPTKLEIEMEVSFKESQKTDRDKSLEDARIDNYLNILNV